MKNNILLLLGTCFCLAATAQKNNGTYDWAIGIKYQPAAISVKKYFRSGDAVEMICSRYDEGYRLTGLLELCPALDFPRHSLRMILGPGLHTGFRKRQYLRRHETNPVFGFDGIFGMEWKIPGIPIALQADYQPGVDVIGNEEIFRNWGGATIRVTF